MKVTVRLSPEDHALLEHVAHKKRTPAAVLLRQWAMDNLLKEEPQWFEEHHDDQRPN